MDEPNKILNRYSRPALPQGVARLLRQEAGFGCAKCGHPYIEYHHIIPFAEENHFRPEDMIALCGNCHPSVSKQQRDRQYEIKAKPYNRNIGRFNGALEYDKRDLVFKIGGQYYENVKNIIQLNDTPIISCRLEDGQAMIHLHLMDKNFRTLLLVEDNQVSFRVNDIWDFQYQHNLAVVRQGKGNIVLHMDFRGAEATISGSFQLGQQIMRLGKDEAVMGGLTFGGNGRLVGAHTGLQLGDENVPLPKYCAWPKS